jgi:hypothetical protein
MAIMAVATSELGSPAHRVPYNVGRFHSECIEKIIVVDDEIDDIIDVLNAGAGLKSGMRRGVHGKLPGQLGEKRAPAS